MIAELGVYLVGLGVVYYALAISAVSGYRGKVFAIIALLVLSVVPILRGNVGTDTANYEQMASILRDPAQWYGVEPGFAVLLWALGQVTDSDVALIRLVSAIFTLGMLIFIRRADRDEMLFLLAYIMPSVFYQYSMNALRIGLATVFVLMAIQYIRRQHVRTGSVAIVSSWLFHYSALLLTAYLIVASRLMNCRTIIAFGLVGFVFSGLVVTSFGDYLLPRIAAYSVHQPPGGLSGLSIVVPLVIVMLGAALSSLCGASRMTFLLVTFVSVAGAFVLARYTYAGLRVLDLLSVAAPAALLVLHGREHVAFNWRVKFSLVVAGAVTALGVLRGFLQTSVQGESPWVPYEWVF